MGVMNEHLAIYAGSFDPITNGHLDVLRRARGMFDRVVLGIGFNPDKPSLFPCQEREAMARQLVTELTDEADLAPVSVQSYRGLTVDFARELGASALVRGIRNVTDLASECQLAITNRQVAEVETVFIVTGEAYAFTSSSLIRQIAGLGGDVDRLRHIVPDIVVDRLHALQANPDSLLYTLVRDQHTDEP
jgi:pantetheine-phosphate adenylyltransferase